MVRSVLAPPARWPAAKPRVAFFIDNLPLRQAGIDSVGRCCGHDCRLRRIQRPKTRLLTTGQTSGSGLPLELTFYPMGAGALFMTIFAFECLLASVAQMIAGAGAAADRRLYLAWIS